MQVCFDDLSEGENHAPTLFPIPRPDRLFTHSDPLVQRNCTLRVLKGLTGELASAELLWKSQYKDCSKHDELLAKSGEDNVTIYTNIIELTTEHDLYDVELTFPFPRCKKAKE